MIYRVKGDIFDPQYEVFCHQVNCQHVMGGGLAKEVKNRYPEVYQEYEDREYPFLGAIDWIHTHDNRICVNMYAQEDYGTYERFTDYIGFAQCLVELSDYLHSIPQEYKVAFPDHIGCGLGGGDWHVIYALIQDFEKTIKQDVYIVRKD